MEEGTGIQWDDDRCNETIIEESDQMAAEHLMCLAQEIGYVGTVNEGEYAGAEYEVKTEDFTEEVMEEVITDDWVHDSGQECVEVPMDQLVAGTVDIKTEDCDDVALPTDQDEYTAMRPWPCDFCSRRFRKKAALMNHMVAHQNDRPFGCNLCGARYIRRADLMNHLKVHAYVPDDIEDNVSSVLYDIRPKSKRGRKKKKKPEEEDNYENMTSARTMQWERKTPRRINQAPRSPPLPPPSPSPSSRTRSPTSPSPSPAPIPADPSKPFVCIHCGVGFAREKALKSHSRVHGGESPLECNICGELCWSKESLINHKDRVHSNQSPEMFDDHTTPYDEGEESDFSTPISESSEYESLPDSPKRRDGPTGPELFCPHCGVAFQRTDLLRRHVVAAHVYKKEPRHDQQDWNCEVCSETFADALQLLAHAGSHATPHRTKKTRANGQNFNSNSVKIFACDECGKTFGSRSSQQIHVRIHTGERPYACRFCWKAFADGGTLRKHERIHTGEKPYACAVCPRAFNQRVVLREHIRSHHSAPENRRSSSSFICVVCSENMGSSAELVQHLIEHCDANTALRRQPRVGPRKYKRRRKLKQEENIPLPTPSRRQRRTRAFLEPKIKQEEDLDAEQDLEPEPGAPFKCEMCDLEFSRREALLLHVPVHI